MLPTQEQQRTIRECAGGATWCQRTFDLDPMPEGFEGFVLVTNTNNHGGRDHDTGPYWIAPDGSVQRDSAGRPKAGKPPAPSAA